MKVTLSKIEQIIREEVQNEISDKDKHYGTGYYMGRKQRERERNAGLGGDRVRRGPISLTDEEKEAISDEIDLFLANANDENAGWWPQTWLGGGRVYDPSSKKADKDGYYDRSPEQNAAMRKRFDDLRTSSGRDPFTVDHIKQDIEQSGRSVWYSADGELKHPSLSSFIDQYLLKAIDKALDTKGLEGKSKLKAYLATLSEERAHAPSPTPPMPKEKKPTNRKKRDNNVDHSDKVTGNMTDFGRIAEKIGLTDLVRQVMTDIIKPSGDLE